MSSPPPLINVQSNLKTGFAKSCALSVSAIASKRFTRTFKPNTYYNSIVYKLRRFKTKCLNSQRNMDVSA